MVDTGSMARAYVELPEGWGPQRMVIGEFQRAGYRVEVVKTFGRGPDRLLISTHDEAPRDGGAPDMSSI